MEGDRRETALWRASKHNGPQRRCSDLGVTYSSPYITEKGGA